MAYGNGKQCKAKSKRTQARCKANCVRGMDVCYHHGGKSPRGLASPRIKTGIYSKYLPVNMLSQYESLLSLGDDLFGIGDETSLVVALIQERLKKVKSGESTVAWQRTKGLYQQLAVLGQKQNKSPDDIQKFNLLFVELGEVVISGSMANEAQNEVVSLIEEKRRLVADERRAWAEKHRAMSFDRVLLILTAMVATFKRSLEKHISDDRDRRFVLSDTQKFLDQVLQK